MTKATEAELREKVDAIHDRVYNGLGKDIRDEVNKEVSGLRNLILGILVALLLSLAGIVIEGRVSSNQVSVENNRTYRAIVDIGSKLENHVILTEPRK